MSERRLTVSHTSEQARDVRARAWAYVFGCYDRRKSAGTDNADDQGASDKVRRCDDLAKS